MTLQFRRLSSSTVREVITEGLLPELEFGLLKKKGEELRWTTADKALFCNMAIDELECQQDHLKLKVIVRSFCYSRDVTTDYLSLEERFNMKNCVLIIGNNGCQPAPWAGLIQPAVYLHAHEFNVLCIEIPEYATNTQRWLKYGPSIMRGALRFLCVESVSVLACGNGGAIFLEALGQTSSGFGRTHFVYNLDCPPGTRKAPFPVFQLEELLRENDLQLWFGYNDEEDFYNRYVDGTPRKSHEAISGMQARLEGERRRGKRVQEYDEVLVTEKLNTPAMRNAERMKVGKNTLFIFSEELLTSIARFFEHAPTTQQEDMVEGLVADPNAMFLTKFQDDTELPALKELADASPQELALLYSPVLALGRRERFEMTHLPALTGASSGAGSGNSRTGSGSRSNSRPNSRGYGDPLSMSRSSSAPSLVPGRTSPGAPSATSGSSALPIEGGGTLSAELRAKPKKKADPTIFKKLKKGKGDLPPPSQDYMVARKMMWDTLGADD